MKISIFGDLCPTSSNYRLFEDGKTQQLFNDVLPIINDSCLTIVNLECPLTNSTQRILKSGPHIKSPQSTFNSIGKTGFDLYSLANNHIMDFGEKGLKDTVGIIEKGGKSIIGVGINKTTASEPFYFVKNDMKIGVLAFTDNEFGLATEHSVGSNGLDLIESFDVIELVKSKCDYLVVLLHSGMEHYIYPSPNLQKICRKMIEKGANFITCQHSHIIGTYEIYKNGYIIYGQGNFLFARPNKGKLWNNGLIIEIEFIDGKPSVNFIPTEMVDNGVRLLKGKSKTNILDNFESNSKLIQDKDFIDEEWTKFCKEHSKVYLSLLNGYGSKLIRINNLLKGILTIVTFNKKRILKNHNIIRSETHREALLKVLSLKEDGMERK